MFEENGVKGGSRSVQAAIRNEGQPRFRSTISSAGLAISGKDKFGLLVLAVYVACSLLFFGRGLIGHFTTRHIGEGADPELMMWFLVWWPHAIANGINPLMTHAVWAPSGFNLAWQTCIPLVSLFAVPLTYALGPVATLNVLCLLSLPIAAWCCFFLCRYVSRSYWASILGGYILGFCPFLLGSLIFARLQFVWVFPVPLAVYLVIRRFHGDLTPTLFSFLFGATLVAEFLCSLEIFATMTLFGGIALVLAWLANFGETRERLSSIILTIGISYAFTFLLVSPYLYYFFFSTHPYDGPIWNTVALSADPLNFLIPTPINQLGRLHSLDSISAVFNKGLPAEAVAYLSLPLLVITAIYARRHWHDRMSRIMLECLAIILVCSLGPRLVVGAHLTRIGLPWGILGISVLKEALTGRFCFFAYLIFAIVTSLWLSSSEIKTYVKLAVAGAIVVFMLPNLSASYWAYSIQVPRFFRSGLYRNYLRKGETVLILPFWPRNQSMLWQAETRMYFRMAGGAGPWPANFRLWPIVDGFGAQTYVPDPPEQFRAYLTAHSVSTVIIANGSVSLWRPVVESLGVSPAQIGGVSLYRVPPDVLKDEIPAANVVRQRFDVQRFEDLLIQLDKYLSNGGDIHNLSAAAAVSIGLIPSRSIIGPSEPVSEIRHPEINWNQTPDYRYGLWLFPQDGNKVVIGEEAWHPSAKLLIERYRSTASEVDFVPPNFQRRAEPGTFGTLLMVFDREQLARAAAIARGSLRPSQSSALASQ